MKTLRSIVVCILILLTLNTKSQDDTTLIVVPEDDTTSIKLSEEIISDNYLNWMNKYNEFFQKMREEITLLKLDLVSPIFNTVRIQAEHKFFPSLSVFGETGYGLKDNSLLWGKPNDEDRNQVYFFNIGVRNYYNIGKQIINKESNNNFSANYISGKFYNWWQSAYYDKYDRNTGQLIYEHKEIFDYRLGLAFLYGVQRRIGKYMYFDFNLGGLIELDGPNWRSSSDRDLELNMYNLNFVVNLNFGFAL